MALSSKKNATFSEACPMYWTYIDVVFQCSLRTQIREFRGSVDIAKVPVKSQLRCT